MTIDERPRAPHRPTPLRTEIAPASTPTQNDKTLPADRVRRWQRGFAMTLSISDALVIAIAVFASQVIRFVVTGGDELVISGVHDDHTPVAYTVVSIAVVIGWLLTLRVFGTRDGKIIGTGVIEYKRVINATLAFFGLCAILAFALQAPIGRAYLLIALPLGAVLLLLSRWLWRRWLVGRRRAGRLLRRAVVVGDRTSALHVAEQIERDPGTGIRIVAAITEAVPDYPTFDEDHNSRLTDTIPIIGDWGSVLDHVDAARADTVIVTGDHTLEPRELRELGWGLEERKARLIVAPALTDIAGPRIHSTPVAGLPLVRIDYPEFTGLRRAVKRTSDVVISALGLIVLSPLLLAIAIVIRETSRGPALFPQDRVGLQGYPFRMLKFRTMVTDAEKQLSSQLDVAEAGGGLFRMSSDPRITPVGRFLRRYSLDDLPQLWNVFKGDMSLIGPRPPLGSEVQTYERWLYRRLLVKPGITGLQQVSGRGELSWEDSVRLDLYYVENWSITTDLMILWRTVRGALGR